MIALRWTLPLSLALAALAACGTTPDARFYTLEPLAVPEAGGATDGAAGAALLVSPVDLPELLDRPQMITRVGPNEVAVHEYDRWVEPLGQGITRVLAENLGALLGADRVSAVLDTETRPPGASRLDMTIVRFEGGPERQCTLVARWELHRGAATAPATLHHSVLSAEMTTRDGAGFAAAMSRNLESLAREIAAALSGGP